jgi:hypothetical protein
MRTLTDEEYRDYAPNIWDLALDRGRQEGREEGRKEERERVLNLWDALPCQPYPGTLVNATVVIKVADLEKCRKRIAEGA